MSIDKPFLPNPNVKAEHGGTGTKHKQKKKVKVQTQTKESKSNDPDFDIWGEDKSDTTEPLPDDWFQPTLKKKVKMPVKAKPSEREAIEIVSSGASYNPETEAHQKLLRKAADIRLEGLSQEKKYRAYNRNIQSLGPLQVDLRVEIGGVEEEENEVTSQVEDEPKSNYSQFIDKKTRTDRNKEKRRKIHEAIVSQNQEKKRRRKELESLDAQLEDIEQTTKILEKQKELKQLAKANDGYKYKKLGKIKFREDEPEFLLTEELPGSLRRIPGKYSLMKDRFDSLKKRNIIETRVPSRYVNAKLSRI